MDRWATFDCYGTLIDWDGGIRRELERLFGVRNSGQLVERFHELEATVKAETYRTYRAVLTVTLERLAQESELSVPEGEMDAVARSLPSWTPFPDVPPALEELRRRGWRLAILSNSDRDLIEASRRQIGVAFDRTIVAEDIGSYKPNHGHWEAFFERTCADRAGHVHVAASRFYDIAPAGELGLRSVWVNRLGERPGPEPAREVPDLSPLPDVLDELVPASR